jgi:hypothetical protein
MAQTYTPLATTTLTSDQATVTFSSISSAYTDLVLIFRGTCSFGNPGSDININFNSDTGTNYSRTYLLGDGTSVSSGRSSSIAAFKPSGLYYNMYQITHINNYANTTTYKTALSKSTTWAVSNATGYIAETVGLWSSTAAINRIDITISTGTAIIGSGSTFTLYGIKAA